MTEAEIERQKVEAVFGLTGGELMDVPWETTYDTSGTTREVAWPHWYEGIPEWLQEPQNSYKGSDLHIEGAEYRTLIPAPNPYSGPPKELKDESGTWKLVRTFGSSGETACVLNGGGRFSELVDSERAVNGHCPFCGESAGDKHGHIYLGEGSCEAVYKLTEGEGNDG